MAATCAVCRQPITKQTKFVVAGTEAVHDVCIANLGQSLANRLRQELIRIKGVLDGASIELRHQRPEIERARGEAEQLRRELAAERELSASLRRQMDVYLTSARRLEREVREAQETIDRTSRTLVQVGRERDAARSELALMKALGHEPASGSATGNKDDRDASEIRFSLLDLDKP